MLLLSIFLSVFTLTMEFSMKQSRLIAIGCCLMLAACGTTKEDRAASGGLIGAGAGAVIGSTVGAPVAAAAIGAGVGATTGALTDPDKINWGKPIWK